jgi:CPA2 family monovalent cation:H+ antiporter-2
MLAVSGLLVFSGQIFSVVEGWLGRDWGVAHGPEIVFWTGMSLVLLAPLVAIWRNCSALALLFAQVSTQGHTHAARLAPVVETGLKTAAGAGMFLWLVAILPAEGTARWLLLASALVAAGALVFLRQKLIFWHSHLEVELNSAIEPAGNRMTVTAAPWLQPHGEWHLQMIDCTLPDLADCKGRSIAELELRKRTGCSVVGIERQGFMIPLPTPAAVLYPRDKVLLLGTPEQVQAGKTVLGAVSGEPSAESLLDEVRMEALAVPADSRAAGWTLGELSPSLKHGVQIAGLNRRGLRILNPGAGECVKAGDELLTLGPLEKLRDFKAWLREPSMGPGASIG